MYRFIFAFSFILCVSSGPVIASSHNGCLDDDVCESVIAHGIAKALVSHSNASISIDAEALETAAGALERHWSRSHQLDDDISAVRLSFHRSLASQIATHPRLSSLSLSFGMRYDERPFYMDALGKLLAKKEHPVPLRELCMDAQDLRWVVRDGELLQHLESAPALKTLKVCHIHMGSQEDSVCALLKRVPALSQGKNLGLYGLPARDGEEEARLYFTGPVIDALARARFEHVCVSTLDVRGVEREFVTYVSDNRDLKSFTVLGEIHLLEEEKVSLKDAFDEKGPGFLRFSGRVITYRSAPTAWDR